MDYYDQASAWHDFDEGRARFSGSVRGVDELGHETFAVVLRETEFFGEIDQVFAANRNDYNIEVSSFGYLAPTEMGIPIAKAALARSFTEDEATTIRQLVVKLVNKALTFEERPVILDESSRSHFLGKIMFRTGWIVVRDALKGAVAAK